MSTPTVSERLAAFAADLTYDSLPPDLPRAISERFLDTVGVMVAALPLPVADRLQRLVREAKATGASAPVGERPGWSRRDAAFVNATLAHGVEFDDTHPLAIVHPSAFVVSAALASGLDSSGREVVAAAAAGYETLIRLGLAAYDAESRNSLFFERGLHGASICGALGSAVTAAKLLGLGRREIQHALGIAAGIAAGTLEANRTGGTVKPVQAGFACHAGLWAAELARAGITAPATAIEGRFGFFQALLGRDLPVPLDDLGSRWTLQEVVVKPYPTNHFTHAAIDAALAIRAELGRSLSSEEVASVDLGVASPTLRTIAEPRPAKVRPESGYHARFSGPFTVALALTGGGGLGVALEDFTDARVTDPALLALAEKVEVHADAECDRLFPEVFPAVLRVELTSGRTLGARVTAMRGGPARPLTTAELQQKYRGNAAPVLGADRAEALAAMLLELPELPSLTSLPALWTPARRPIPH